MKRLLDEPIPYPNILCDHIFAYCHWHFVVKVWTIKLSIILNRKSRRGSKPKNTIKFYLENKTFIKLYGNEEWICKINAFDAKNWIEWLFLKINLMSCQSWKKCSIHQSCQKYTQACFSIDNQGPDHKQCI